MDKYEKAFEVAINFIKNKGLYEEYKKLKSELDFVMTMSIKNKEDFIKIWEATHNILLKDGNTPATITYNNKALKIVTEELTETNIDFLVDDKY